MKATEEDIAEIYIRRINNSNRKLGPPLLQSGKLGKHLEIKNERNIP